MKKYIDTGKKDTRSGFGVGLLEAGRADSRVVALTADLKGSLKMDRRRSRHHRQDSVHRLLRGVRDRPCL